MKYIILGHKNYDGTFYDTSLFPETDDRMDNEAMTHDPETGIKYAEALEFEDDSWAEACQIMNDFLGYGKYIPMQDRDNDLLKLEIILAVAELMESFYHTVKLTGMKTDSLILLMMS